MAGGTVLNTWTNQYSRASGFAVPDPIISATGTQVANSKGNWLVAIVSWRQDAGAVGTLQYPSVSQVSDDSDNFWIPAGTTTANLGIVRSSVWIAPGARPANWVYVSSDNFQNAMAVTIIEVTALAAWYSFGSVITTHANQQTSDTMTLSPPASGMFAVGVLSTDNNSITVTPVATGWTALTTAVATNGSDHLADITQLAWTGITGTASNTISGSSGSALDYSGLIICFHGVTDAVSAPAQPSPDWPIVITEIGYGSYLTTEPGAITWTDVSARNNSDAHVQIGRGIQYNQQALEAGTCSVPLDNNDGFLTPNNAASPFYPFAGDEDIPFRLRTIWPGGPWQVSFHGTGAIAAPQIDTGNIFGVVPGQTYTASAWIACSVAYAAGVVLSVRFKNGGGTLLQTNTSPKVTGIDSVLVTASGVAPAGAVTANIVIGALGTPASTVVFSAAAAVIGPGYLTVPPGVSWVAENSATVSTLAPFAPNRAGPPNVCPYKTLFSGYTDKSQSQWDQTLRGYVLITAADAYARLTSQMLTAAAEEVTGDSPAGYWPLNDAAGSGTGANLAQGGLIPLTVQISKNGRGNAVNTFGSNVVSSSGMAGDPSSTCWTLSGMVAGGTDFNNGFSLSYFPPNPASMPPLANGVTLEFWVNAASGTQPGTSGEVLILGGCYGPRGPLWQLTINSPLHASPGGISMVTYDQTTGAATTTSINSLDFFTGANFLYSVTFTRTTWSVYIDAGGTSLVSGSGANFSPVYNGFILNGQNGGTGGNGSGACLNGSYYGAALFSAILPQTRIVSHYFVSSLGENNAETDTQRIRRVIGYGGFVPALASRGTDVLSLAIDDFGDFVTPITDTLGQVVSAYLTNITQSSLAAMFIPGGGALTYRRRAQWYDRTLNSWTLGENSYAGETPYLVDLSLSKDRTQLYNTAVVTQAGNAAVQNTNVGTNVIQANTSGVTVQAQNAASVANRGGVPYTASSYMANTSAATGYLPRQPSIEDYANWIVQTGGNPVLRAEAVNIIPAKCASPTGWLMALYAEVGDASALNRRPMDGVVTTVPTWISRVSHDISFGELTWETNYQLSPYPQGSVLDCDDPVNGVLDGTSLLGW